MRRILICLLLPIFIVSCIPFFSEKDGKFLSEVVNLEEFNSEFDDYNSDIAYNKSGQTHLLFSSKRKKKNLLNLVYFQAEFSYDGRLGLKRYDNIATKYKDYFLHYHPTLRMAEKANGNFNVFGPKTISLSRYLNAPERNDLLLFYADDYEGNLEIKYVPYLNSKIEEPVKFNILNSSADDAYPTFSREGDKIYFCSNREGNFDIYEVSIPVTVPLNLTAQKLVNPENYTIRKVEELSTPYDDKCPAIDGNKMIFVSNKPDGFGGFDIYESKLVKGKWQTPVNLGNRINTRNDEYRPIFVDAQAFSYQLLVFSSNRPGGKGGFDLYMTGLED
ncbi:hypothetical protein L0657_22765 [Dyadobacter sp. CY345]|uniref:TolB family protein n=1 Tax=Dyadobacter sp. CY345 TaxID=2909335 RepID=UPI001F351105|nr:hypothetical protein [Dyadobacter sp. CY345]MCF2446796.1 hypothetical protein [Dyadobacter sp. CY345]